MKKIFNPVFWFSLITFLLFLMYEKYLGFFVITFNIPFIPHMRTSEAAVMKYLPLIIVIMIAVYVYSRKIKKEESDKD